MDTIFIQFYSNYKKVRDNEHILVVYNGFSDTYDLCKSKGDFYWVNIDSEEDKKLPINKGKAYVSVVHIEHLSQLYKWAIEYPDIQFIVGGPAIQTNSLKYTRAILSNVETTKKTVEEYFNVPNFSGNFNIDLNGIKHRYKHGTLLCTYTLDPNCYWGKCRFCTYHFQSNQARKNMNFSFLDNIDFDGQIQLRLNIPSITPEYIDLMFSNIKNTSHDIIYDLLLRCDNSIYKALKRNFENLNGDFPRLKMRLGVEFMSDRVLKMLNKGFTTKDINRMINLLDRFDTVQTYVHFMIGIPDIIKQDVEKVRKHITTFKKVSSVNIFRLICFLNTDIYDSYKHRKLKKVIDNGIYGGYYPRLSNKDFRLNIQVEEILKRIPCDWLYYESLKENL